MKNNDYLPPPNLSRPTVHDAFKTQLQSDRLDRAGVGWCSLTMSESQLSDDLRLFVERLYTNRNAILTRRGGVYLWGEHGVGKSYATAYACRALVASGYSCLWLTINQLIDCYINRQTYLFDGEPLWLRVLDVHFLFVDDLGKETNNHNIAQMVERMLRERLQSSGKYAATIITSNIPYPTKDNVAIDRRYGEGMVTLLQRSTLSRQTEDTQSRRDNVRQLAQELQ